MERRTIAILAVVALVAVAGCSGLTGSDDPSETEGPTDAMTDTDSPGESTTTSGGPSLADISYPAGATEGGFDNVSAVAAGHADALAESAYAVSLSQQSTEGNRSSELRYDVRSNPDSQRVAGTLATSNYRNQWYGNATHQHANVTTDGSSNLQVRERSTDFSENHRQETLSPTVQSVLASGNYTATAVVERNGETAVRYELEEYNASENPDFETESATGTVVVGESGVVYEASLAVTGTSNGSDVSLELTYEVTETGDVSVERPAWVDDV